MEVCTLSVMTSSSTSLFYYVVQQTLNSSLHNRLNTLHSIKGNFSLGSLHKAAHAMPSPPSVPHTHVPTSLPLHSCTKGLFQFLPFLLHYAGGLSLCSLPLSYARVLPLCSSIPPMLSMTHEVIPMHKGLFPLLCPFSQHTKGYTFLLHSLMLTTAEPISLSKPLF